LIRIETGDIVPSYPYLWRRERDLGEDAGRKPRPVCVAISIKDEAGLTHLALLAITGTEPLPGQESIEIPALEIRRVGLRDTKRAWVIVSEYNYDVLEKSFAIAAPQEPLKRLSSPFLKQVLTAFRPTLAGHLARIDRR
jgi:hypothetical protein